jgi:hypothetical protein
MEEGTVEVDEANNEVGFEGFARPYMPGANFQRCLRNAATKWKLGKDVLRSVVVTNNPELIFDGPKDAVDMFNYREPKLQLAAFTGRGVWVNRLFLPDWSAKFDLTLDDEIMGVDQLRRIANMAGKAEGLFKRGKPSNHARSSRCSTFSLPKTTFWSTPQTLPATFSTCRSKAGWRLCGCRLASRWCSSRSATIYVC